MSNNQKRIEKELTYEEIGKKIGISPQQVHKIEKDALNKIIRMMRNCSPNNTIFEILFAVSDHLGISLEQLYNKLDKENLDVLGLFVQEQYGKTIEGWSPDENPLEKFFA